MKYIFFILLFSFYHIRVSSQFSEFLIGYYSYDYDNKQYIPLGTDKAIGNDLAFLNLVKDFGTNYVHINYQLFYPVIYAVENPSKAFLDRASSLNLKVILRCPDIQIDRINPSYNSTNSLSALNYYGSHPSIIGFDIIDEPRATLFTFINNYANDIKSYNPGFLRLANLFPSCASNDQLFGTDGWPTYDDYDRYVQQYIDVTRPNIISFDHYPILWRTNNFFINLDVFARRSVSNNIPFIYVLTQLKHELPYCYQIPTEVKNIYEFNYVIFASLIYGAKGISYWHANCTNDFFGIIPPASIDYLKILHDKLKKSSKTLLNLKFQSVYHKSNLSTIVPGVIEQIPGNSLWTEFRNDLIAQDVFNILNPIQAISGSKTDNIVVSFLKDDVDNKYFWIFNKSVTDDENIQLNFKASTALFNILDNEITDESLSKEVFLEPGEAKLFLINRNFLSTVTICNKLYTSIQYSPIWGSSINIGGTGCNVNYSPNSKVTYYAKNIKIANGVKINEGSKVSFNGGSYVSGTLKATSNNEGTADDLLVIDIIPNPNEGKFLVRITGENQANNCEIYDLTGHKLYEIKNLNTTEFNVDLELKTGIYILNVQTTRGVFNKKFHVF